MTAGFTVASIGGHAARLIARAPAARVAAVFEQSFHVEAGGGFLCIGGPELGNGPLNALCNEQPDDGWHGSGLAEGQACVISPAVLLIIGGPVFELTNAVPWQPPPWPARCDPKRLAATLAALGRLSGPRAPRDGIARVAFGEATGGGLARATLRAALLATATLSDWLDVHLGDGNERDDPGLAEAAGAAVSGLIGLGGGLTPAGDDLLAGLLIALQATGATATAAALAGFIQAGFIQAGPAGATSPLSRAFLAAAIDGQPSAAMHDVISTLLAGDATRLPAALDRIDRIGHTSGWDMLAGAVLGLAAVAHM